MILSVVKGHPLLNLYNYVYWYIASRSLLKAVLIAFNLLLAKTGVSYKKTTENESGAGLDVQQAA